MAVTRHFLGWDAPLTELACRFLLPGRISGTADLESTLIVVPTRQAGRSLREALAARCARQGAALLSAQTVPVLPMLSELDAFQNTYLPISLDDTLRRLPDRAPAGPPEGGSTHLGRAASFVRDQVAGFEAGGVADSARAFLRTVYAVYLFDPETRDVLDFGSAIHALFEQVEWIETADPESIIAAWGATAAVTDEVKRDVCEQFRASLRAEEVRRALARPPGNVGLWREKRFEIVNRDGWVTGAFDRVTIRRDAGGRPVQAEIMDFKSNRIATEQELDRAVRQYREQLLLYGQALAQILRLDRTAIETRILFTRAGRVRQIPAQP
ncbi:MAG: PD-(D/E)XK nuclease family protein [Kiritimatiellae bacterium]|nr:PD-(D/E)XK nuclease family protein [Kiritimatiellia bacterium]